MTSEDFVCPRCGATASGERFCTQCGLDLAQQYELPRRTEWERRHESDGPRGLGQHEGHADAIATPSSIPAATSSSRGHRGLSLAALITAPIAAVLFFVSTFLPWLGTDEQDETASFWEFADAADVLAAISGALLVGLVVTAALVGRRSVFTAGIVAGAGVFVALGALFAIEILAIGANDLVSFTEVEPEYGAAIAAAGGAVAIGAMIVAVLADVSDRRAVRPDRVLTTRVGLILMAVGGLFAPVWLFLPDDGVSQWEGTVVVDIVLSVLGAALTTLALIALLRRHPPAIAMAASAVGIVIGAYALITSIEGLAEDSGAPAFVGLLVLAPLCIAGYVLVAVGAHPRPEGASSPNVDRGPT